TLLLPSQPDGAPAADALARGMSPPHFPITPYGLRGDWTFGTIGPGPLKAEGFTVEAREIPHKGGRTFGYRVSDGRSTLAYLSDHWPIALGPGPDGFGEYHEAALRLTSGVDLLLHDSQYTAEEFVVRADFGHSTIDYAVGLAREARVGRLVLFHHDPARTDDELDAIAAHRGAEREAEEDRHHREHGCLPPDGGPHLTVVVAQGAQDGEVPATPADGPRQRVGHRGQGQHRDEPGQQARQLGDALHVGHVP